MKQFDLIFIATFINELTVNKLIQSISINNKHINLFLVLVNQTESLIHIDDFKSDWVFIKQIKSGRISLSAARNIGIKYVLDNEINSSYILFPDDDSSFDNHFFSQFKNLTLQNSNFLIDVFGENTKDLYVKNNLSHGKFVKDNKLQIAMSVNMLINSDTFRKVGFFDEKMGVGAKYGAGEDTDYFLRGVAISGPFGYNKLLWNYHPKFESKYENLNLKELIRKYKNYGRGVIYLYVKHKLYFMGIKSCFNALFGSFIAFLKLDFKLSLARFYAFFIRTYTFLMLILGVYK